MKKQFYHQEGQAALLIMFIFGMFTLYTGLSLVNSGYVASLLGRSPSDAAKALYAANSGIEDGVWQVTQGYSPAPYDLTVDISASARVTISGTDIRTITAIGKSGLYTKKISTTIQNSTIKPGFSYAVQTGGHDLEMEGNTNILGKNSADGNVYSNGNIKGAKNDHTGTSCKSNASAISGFATAVNAFDKLANNDSGVCVAKNASASALLNCYIGGIPKGPNTPAASCPSGGAYTAATTPPILPLPDMQIAALKNYMTQNANTRVFSGNCVADLSGNISDCTMGNNHMGLLKINGNMTINTPSAKALYVNGPIWVTGNLIINSNSGTVSVDPDPSVTQSQIFLVEGTITSASNVTFGSSGSKFLIFLSTFLPNPVPSDLCSNPAITLSSNANSVLFYAINSCIMLTANSNFHGSVIGEKIHISNNSTIEYDPGLANAIFSYTKSGGWATVSYVID